METETVAGIETEGETETTTSEACGRMA